MKTRDFDRVELDKQCENFTDYFRQEFESSVREFLENYAGDNEKEALLRIRRAVYESIQGFEPLNLPNPTDYKDEDFDY